MQNQILEQLNLSKKEIQVYLALLELGSAKANDLAKTTGLNRTSIYDLTESLAKMGLISKYKKGASTIFNARDPKEIIGYLDREKEEKIKEIETKKSELMEILPQLISLQNINSTKPRVEFFEGEKGMRQAYEDTLNCKDIIYGYANVQTMHEGLPNFFPEYYARRVAKKIPSRGILTRNKMSLERIEHNIEELRQSKFLPDEKMTFSPEINLYNNKMLIVSWKEKMAVIIESKELVDLQKLIFNLLWDSLPNN
jgi:sugar-specific transcriptional regulator TrmB